MDTIKTTTAITTLVDVSRTLAKKGTKSKTVWFGTALSVLGVVQMFTPEIASLIEPHGGLFTSAVGFAVILLRAITNSSLADK